MSEEGAFCVVCDAVHEEWNPNVVCESCYHDLLDLILDVERGLRPLEDLFAEARGIARAVGA